MIYLIGGTKDSRQLTKKLLEAGYEVVVSVATEYGEKLVNEIEGVEVIADRLDQSGMEEVIEEYNVDRVIDATHPFAALVSQTAIKAAASKGKEYLRFERPPIELPESELIIEKAGFEAALDYLKGTTGRILLTIGSKELDRFVTVIPDFNQRVVARVLPTAGVLQKCQQELGIPPANLIAIQGPFSQKLNQQLLIDYGIDLLVTKASGKTGGLDTKLQAALDLKLPVLVIRRPEIDYPQLVTNMEELVDQLN
ncbi:precorrin-6A reductase [Acetohalobium arabaticum]|uniref:Precorrin-6x reductase n=1 Tax=Acetohalobium arabaticum (strain ATCC 49924 / DSM 5501 / Z-7288) TaxID=574087 RepID=D9QVW4_ACEAZ|nr:precorrin-6A reductase [Acetohalobium arabaticum]ADL12373.1 precorrin-6x reductase [Acetohalobium arabaticum DSM 5501]